MHNATAEPYHLRIFMLWCEVRSVREPAGPLDPQPQVLSSPVYFKLHIFSTEPAPVATNAHPHNVWYRSVNGMVSTLI